MSIWSILLMCIAGGILYGSAVAVLITTVGVVAVIVFSVIAGIVAVRMLK